MKLLSYAFIRTTALLALCGLLVTPVNAEPTGDAPQLVAQRYRQKKRLGNRLDEFSTIIGSSHQQVRLLADLDGDGVRDQIYLVKLTKSPPADVVVQALASEEAASPKRGTRALAIVLNPGDAARYFVFVSKDGFPLEGPSWETDDFTGLVGIGAGPEPPSDAKGETVNITTESGAGWYIHWNGSAFVDSNQGDQP